MCDELLQLEHSLSAHCGQEGLKTDELLRVGGFGRQPKRNGVILLAQGFVQPAIALDNAAK